MADHDPLCLRDPDDPDRWPCQCHTIARARADERRRIADAIRDECAHQLGPGGPCYRCRACAAIARDGGQR